MIRDHIIVHTPHDSVRADLLQKQRSTLTDVLLIAEPYEATTTAVGVLKEVKSEKTIGVNLLKRDQFKQNRKYENKNKENSIRKFKSCSGCFSKHKREECKFKNATCNKCGKKGHIAAVCMSKTEDESKT